MGPADWLPIEYGNIRYLRCYSWCNYDVLNPTPSAARGYPLYAMHPGMQHDRGWPWARSAQLPWCVETPHRAQDERSESSEGPSTHGKGQHSGSYVLRGRPPYPVPVKYPQEERGGGHLTLKAHHFFPEYRNFCRHLLHPISHNTHKCLFIAYNRLIFLSFRFFL